jgi:hypothetical protein
MQKQLPIFMVKLALIGLIPKYAVEPARIKKEVTEMGYLDPGLFGILSQVGLTIFLLVTSTFVFFFKPIKKFFSKIFKGKNAEKTEDSSKEEQSIH